MTQTGQQLFTEQQLIEHIIQTFSKNDNHIPLDLREDAIKICTVELLAEIERSLPDQERLVDKSLNEKDTYYAIHNEDFKFIDESTAIVAGLWTLFSNPLSVIGKLLVLLYRYRKRRAQLTKEQAVTLFTLKRAAKQGWTLREIQQELPLKANLSLEELEIVLISLKSIQLADGTLTAFANENDGRWWGIDV